MSESGIDRSWIAGRARVWSLKASVPSSTTAPRLDTLLY
jgi:hypothetical protein